MLFRDWHRILPNSIEVCPVELPGRGRLAGEPPFTNLRTAVRAIAEIFSSTFRAQPFALFGHSMGALMAFELDRLLETEHEIQAEMVFVAGAGAPRVRPSDPPTWNLSDQEFVQELKRINGTPPELLQDADAREYVLPILRGLPTRRNLSLRGWPSLACPLAAFGGVADPETPATQIQAWRDHAAGSFSAANVQRRPLLHPGW